MEVDRLVLKGLLLSRCGLLVFDKAVDGLRGSAVAVGYILSPLPPFWSLSAHFAPLEHEPFDVNCLQSPLYPSSFVERTTGIAVSFSATLLLLRHKSLLLLILQNVCGHCFQLICNSMALFGELDPNGTRPLHSSQWQTFPIVDDKYFLGRPCQVRFPWPTMSLPKPGRTS